MQSQQPPSATTAPPIDGDTGNTSHTRRRLLGIALVAMLLIVLAYAMQSRQAPIGPRWGPGHVAGTWDWWLAPREVNRWQRPSPKSGVPNVALRSVSISKTGKVALAVGDGGAILRSKDAGHVWRDIASDSKADLQSVALSPDGRSALAAGGGGVILRSDDAGQVWRVISTNSKAGLQSVAWSPDGSGALAVGDGSVILRSDDSGLGWHRIANGSKADLQSVALTPDGSSALAVGWDGAILRSSDAGLSWLEIDNDSKAYLQSVAVAPDGRSALAMGLGGVILRSDDVGQTWREVAGTGKAHLFSVSMGPDSRSALAVGWNSAILRSNDAGLVWREVASGNQALLQSVAQDPVTRKALAVGLDGIVLRSDDAGQHWTPSGLYQRQPAPWYWAITVLIGLVSLSLAVWLQWSPYKIKRASDHGKADLPISKADQDRLAFSPAVKALGDFLRNSATRPPLTVAINARWGMGKSSFMNLLWENFRSSGARPVWFNVWHHQHEDILLAPLLQAVRRQALPSLWHLQGWRFRIRLVTLRSRKGGWAVWMGLLALASAPAYMACLVWRIDGKSQAWGPMQLVDQAVRDVVGVFHLLTGGQWIAAAKGDGLLDILGAAIMGLSKEPTNALLALVVLLLIISWVMLLTYLLRAFPANPATLLASVNLRFSLAQAEKQSDFRLRFRSQFQEVTHALAPRTMVIFIDDLDRCKPEKAVELLEALNYLTDAGPCFIVLGMAREIVEAQVASAHKALAEEQSRMQLADIAIRSGLDALPNEPKEIALALERLRYARKYLRKLIQLDLRLPSLKLSDAEHLLAPEPVAAQPPARVTPMQAVRTWGARWSPRIVHALICLAGVAIAIKMVLQVPETMSVIESEKKKTSETAKKELQPEVASLRSELEQARVYQQWLRRMGGLPPEKVPAPARLCATAAQAPASKSFLAGADTIYVARAAMVQQDIDLLAQLLPELEQQALVGNRKAFKSLREDKVAPAVLALNTYMNAPQPDGRQWADIRKALAPNTATRTGRGSSDNLPPPNSRDVLDRPSSAAAATVNDAVTSPWWNDAALLTPLTLTLLLALWSIRARDKYLTHPTEEYLKAAARLTAHLMAHENTRSPREIARFLNLSRYAVARLRPSAPTGSDGKHKTAQPHPSPPSETRIVEFTAKWLVARLGKGRLQDVDDLLRGPPYVDENGPAPTAAEIAAFRTVIGEMGTEEATSDDAANSGSSHASSDTKDVSSG